MLPKFQIGDFVRDQVSQVQVKILDIQLQDYLGDQDGPFWLYYTDAGPDDSYPHGHRLENEIEDRDFVGPLVPR
jgi:hypothetical protein